MTEKLPTINIKGKEYVQVKDRILYFNENYKNGSITTELLSDLSSKLVIIKATVIPDVAIDRKFTGYSQAIIGGNGINATAALENCETSAVGRALGMMGIGVIESVASADEVLKASPKTTKPQTTNKYPGAIKVKRSKAEQIALIESGNYTIEKGPPPKAGQIQLYKLVDKDHQFNYLDEETIQFMKDMKAKAQDRVSAAKEVFGENESSTAKANRATVMNL